MTPLRAAIAAVLAGLIFQSSPGDEPKKLPTAWEFDEALQQLAFHPKDPYLQYVALQLGKRTGREVDAVRAIERQNAGGLLGGPGRRERVDLFSTFTGALAIQESLQLDTMHGQAANRPKPAQPLPEKVAVEKIV